MTIMSLRATPPRPALGDLVARAAAVGALVRERAEHTEADRRAPAEAIARMRDAGLLRIMQPAIYGGYEYGFDALVHAVGPVAAGCGSSGWVFSLYIVHQWLAATFPKQAQDEYWSDPDPIMAGSYAPVGKAVPVDGGYRLAGNWSFTSGCDHAQWLLVGGMVPPAKEGAPPKPTFFLLPRADVRLDDNWFTMGLAGTGSKNTVVDNVFVPAYRIAADRRPARRNHTGRGGA